VQKERRVKLVAFVIDATQHVYACARFRVPDTNDSTIVVQESMRLSVPLTMTFHLAMSHHL
jgi:hypothetical protein